MNNDPTAITPEMLAQLPKALRIEIDENVQRKDFTETELAHLQRRLIGHLSEEAKKRQLAGRAAEPAQPRDVQAAGPEGVPPSTAPKAHRRLSTTEKVARMFGEKEETVRRRLAVVEAAENAPEKYGKIIENMDKTGRVNGAYKQLKVRKQAEQIRAEPPPLPNKGPYRVIVADPPWSYSVRQTD